MPENRSNEKNVNNNIDEDCSGADVVDHGAPSFTIVKPVSNTWVGNNNFVVNVVNITDDITGLFGICELAYLDSAGTEKREA